MRFQMIDADQRQSRRQGQPLGRIQADDQRTRQPRPARDGNGIQLARAEMRLLQRAPDGRLDCFHVTAGGHLRKYAAVWSVDFRLGIEHVGKHPQAVLDHGRAGVVTGGFNAKDAQRELGRGFRQRLPPAFPLWRKEGFPA